MSGEPNLPASDACCGCTACASICPRMAISMVEDLEGFVQPHADPSACINCGLCERVCPVLHPGDARYIEENGRWVAGSTVVRAMQSRDVTLRLASTSGGVFSELGKLVLAHQGVVFGVGIDYETGVVAFRKVETIEELAALRGSKYVAANLGDSFKQVKISLREGRKVLFSGTPCQVAGLRRFLDEPCDRLMLVELVCHATPSPLAWHCYVRPFLGKVAHVAFRTKRVGWKTYAMSLADARGRELVSHWRGYSYLWGFLGNLFNRRSCHACAFRGGRSGADITLGDCWGIGDAHPEMDDNRGTSLVMAHTPEGKRLIETLEGMLKSRSIDFDVIVQHNPALVEDPPCHAKRDAFLAALHDGANFETTIRKMMGMTLPQRIFKLVRSRLRKMK